MNKNNNLGDMATSKSYAIAFMQDSFLNTCNIKLLNIKVLNIKVGDKSKDKDNSKGGRGVKALESLESE